MKTQFVFTKAEIQSTQTLLNELRQQFNNPEDTQFIHNATVFAHNLPLRLRQYLNDFRLCATEIPPVCLISGYPIDDVKIGATPNNRKERKGAEKTFEIQALLVLCSSLLGDAFGWSTLQAGYLLNDIFPAKGQEQEQIGLSSKEALAWHTEDSFHPYRADYLGFLCLRNPSNTGTCIASNKVVSQLSETQINILFEPRFVFRADDSHLHQHKPTSFGGSTDKHMLDLLEKSCDNVKQMNETPQAMPVLFGSKESPYFCMDEIYVTGIDDEATAAVHALIDIINNNLSDLILQPGDICFVDNYRAVHGRRSFAAQYDGTDRWLKLINITKDLRKSRDMRKTDGSRFI